MTKPTTRGALKRAERRAARKAEQARIDSERGGFSRAKSPKPLSRERGFVGEHRRVVALFPRPDRYRCNRCKTLVDERDRAPHWGRCSADRLAREFTKVG